MITSSMVTLWQRRHRPNIWVCHSPTTWTGNLTSPTSPGKLTITLGFIRRNVKIQSKSVKQSAYKALVRPILEYAGTVWDPYQDDHIRAVEKVQRRAARWVGNDFYPFSSVEEMLNNLEWPTLQTRRKRARLTMFYKFHHGIVCIDSKCLPSVSASRRSSRRTHSLYTRSSHRTQMSFFPRTVLEWNDLPAETVMAASIATFQARVASVC